MNVIQSKRRVKPSEKSEIEIRVKRVQQLSQQSTKAWLEIAREFQEAKAKLSPLAFDRFVNEVGVTSNVADKLLSIGKKNILHREEYLEYVSTLRGWTVVYELSKLDDATIAKVMKDLKSDPSKRLTREIIESYSKKSSAAPKMLMIAHIEIDSRSAELITEEKLQRFQDQFDELKREVNKLNSKFAFKEVKKSLKKLQEAANANAQPALVKTAA